MTRLVMTSSYFSMKGVCAHRSMAPKNTVNPPDRIYSLVIGMPRQ